MADPGAAPSPGGVKNTPGMRVHAHDMDRMENWKENGSQRPGSTGGCFLSSLSCTHMASGQSSKKRERERKKDLPKVTHRIRAEWGLEPRVSPLLDHTATLAPAEASPAFRNTGIHSLVHSSFHPTTPFFITIFLNVFAIGHVHAPERDKEQREEK